MLLKSFTDLCSVLSRVVCLCLCWFLGSRYLACNGLLFLHPFPVNKFVCFFQAILEVLFPEHSSCNLCGRFKWHRENWNSQGRISFNFGGTSGVSVLLSVSRVPGCCLVGNVCSHSIRYSRWSRMSSSISTYLLTLIAWGNGKG